MKLKNKNRQIFLIFLFFALSLGVVGLIFEVFYSSYNIKKSTLIRAEKIIEHREKILNNFLNDSKNSITALRNSNIFKNFLEKGNNSQAIEDYFKTFILANDSFMKYRYIDKDGNEIINVNRLDILKNRNIKNTIVQNVANKYYLKNSIEKKDGEVWFSSFDLNKENNKIQTPFVPILRTIYPIRVNNEFQGVLIINHFVEKLLSQILKASIFKSILIDENGYIINHYDQNKNWGKYKKEKHNIKTQFPENYFNIIENEIYLNNEIVSKKLNTDLFNSLYLIYQIDDKYLKEKDKNDTEQLAIEVFFFILISLTFSSLGIRIFGNIFNDYEEQRKLNDRLELASNISKIAFWDYDSKTRNISLSKNFKELFIDIKNSKMLIDNFFLLILSEDTHNIENEFYRSIQKKREFNIKYKTTKNKETKFFEIVGKHFYNDNGRHLKTVGSIYDITQKYLTEKLNEKVTKQAKEFKKLFDRFDQNVIASTTNEKGIITYTSKAFCEISGFTKEELIGSHQNIVRHPDSPSRIFKELWGTIKSGKIWTGEIKNLKKGGGIYWVYAYIYPEFSEDGKINGFSAIRHDITAKKELEFLNKKTNESIEFSKFIQHSLLPQNSSLQSCVKDKFIIWEPKDVIGGDIYNLSKSIDENECLVMVIDCTGHGVPGAFVTMLVKAIEKQYLEILRNSKEKEVNLSDMLNFYNKMIQTILNQKNKALASNVGFDGGIFHHNKKEKTVRFVGASNNMLYYDKEKINLIKGDRVSIGFKNSKENYEYKVHEIKVEEGMKFYLYTDGFIDQIGGEKGFPFGRKRFVNILENNIDKSMLEQKETLLSELKKYQKEYERVDDITIIGFEV